MKTAPKIVIIGRPNVGKSALFNRLCGRRAAIVHPSPGMTLDYLSETIDIVPRQKVEIVDTGGIAGESDGWTATVWRQVQMAAATADLLLLVTDAKTGCHPGDAELLKLCRRHWSDCPRVLAVNKAEGEESPVADFYQLGEKHLFAVSAKRGSGMAALRDFLATQLPAVETVSAAALKLAIVGRPNVGKSTLLNTLLKQQRAVVSEIAGTTRDNIFVEFCGAHGNFILIDTAGLRRRRAVASREKLSVAACRWVLQLADVVFLLVDINVGVTHQDKRIAALVEESGCAVVLLANKADCLSAPANEKRLQMLRAALPFNFPFSLFAISAVSRLPKTAMFRAAYRAVGGDKFSTAKLNKILNTATTHRPPPRAGAVRPKLRYAHQGGSRPLQVVIHGSAVAKIKDDYRRYLSAVFARELSLVGAAVRVVFRAEENPYV